MEEKKDKLAGKLDETKGDLKEGLGEARGDENQQAEGKMDQAKGNLKQGVADAKEKVGEMFKGDDDK